MTKRDEIVRDVNEYLNLHAYKDYGPMGMQFIGKDEVHKIATAVSVTADVIMKASILDADMLIVHHGLFWNTEPREVDRRMELRMNALEETQISLLGYHLALDAHPEIGNNVLAVKTMGAEDLVPFTDIGWGGTISGDNWRGVLTLIDEEYGTAPLAFMYGPLPIRRVCAITGSAGHYIHAAVKEGYDLFLTGEAEEPSKALARELGIHFVAAGHHATERAGVKALGRYIAEKFDVAHSFIDTHNPV